MKIKLTLAQHNAVSRGQMKHYFKKEAGKGTIGERIEFTHSDASPSLFLTGYKIVAIKELQINGKRTGKFFSAKLYVNRVQLTNEDMHKLAQNLGYQNAGELLAEYLTTKQNTVKGTLYCWADAHYSDTVPAINQIDMDFGGVPQW